MLSQSGEALRGEKWNRSFAARVTAAIAGLALSLTGCAKANPNDVPGPAVSTSTAASPADSEPAVANTYTPTPESTPTPSEFNPKSDNSTIEIGNDVKVNFIEKINQLDEIIPSWVTLASAKEDSSQAFMDVDSDNSFHVSYGTDDGTKINVYLRNTGKIRIVKREIATNNFSMLNVRQVTEIETPDGTVIRVIGGNSNFDSKEKWEEKIEELRELKESVDEFNPGGVNRVGETVKPDRDIKLRLSEYLADAIIRKSDAGDPAHVIVTSPGDNNTVGFKVSNMDLEYRLKDPQVQNISPADIVELANQYGITKPSFENKKTYPVDDVDLYEYLKDAISKI